MRRIKYTPTLGLFLMLLDAGQGARLHEAARALVLCATHTANTACYLLVFINSYFLILLIHFLGKRKQISFSFLWLTVRTPPPWLKEKKFLDLINNDKFRGVLEEKNVQGSDLRSMRCSGFGLRTDPPGNRPRTGRQCGVWWAKFCLCIVCSRGLLSPFTFAIIDFLCSGHPLLRVSEGM